MEIEIIKAALAENKKISGWKIVCSEKQSNQLFGVHEKIETARVVDAETTAITVYVDHDGKKGESSFSVYSSMNEEGIKNKITAAAERAKLVFNEPYDIPNGEKLERKVASNFESYDPKELAAKISEAVFKADKFEGGSINALEVFVYKHTSLVVNGRGVDATEIKYDAMVEAIPTWNEGGESVELYEAYRFTEFDENDVTREIEEKMKEVRDRKRAEKPDGKITAPVVLNAKEAGELFTEIAFDLNYSAAYSHSALHKIGDDLQKGDGDKINLTMKGEIKGSRFSAAFDADGVTLADKKLIENGKVVGMFGANRFARYLGEKPTGNLRCVEVEKGTLTDEELGKAPYLECVSLSGLQLDLYNDYIGGEIRLAYYHDGEKVVPVTGISMSGRLSNVLETLKATDKIVTERNYRGPDKIMLAGMEIL